MRWSIAFSRLLAVLLALSAGALPVRGADRTPYTVLAGMAPGHTRSYMAEVAPPGYPAVKLYVEETGRGPTLLFLHGLGASGYALRRLTPQLAATHRVVTVDLRGFGRSDKPFDQAYSALDQAAHVRDFIRKRGLTDITLAGHSFGGAVAIALTLDLNRTHPQTISRLILMDAPAFPQPLSPAVSFLRAPILPLLALNLIPSQVTAQLSLSTDMGNFGHITETDVASYAMPLSEAGAVHALITTARRIVPPDIAHIVKRYPSIRQPTLLLWCRDDPIVPLVTGLSLRRLLPQARLRIIAGCTHVPTEESPQELLTHMQAFLSSTR